MRRQVWSTEELRDVLLALAIMATGLQDEQRIGFTLALRALARALGIE